MQENRTSVPEFMNSFARARALLYVCVCVCVRACVRVFVRARVRACKREKERENERIPLFSNKFGWMQQYI